MSLNSKAPPLDWDEIFYELRGAGSENITILERAPWLDVDLATGKWIVAFEKLDKQRNKSSLLELLRSDWELSSTARAYLADLLDRYEFKNKRGRKRTPAYDRSRSEAMLYLAVQYVRDDVDNGMKVNKAVEKQALSYSIPEQTLHDAYAQRRGSTRRVKKRLPA